MRNYASLNVNYLQNRRAKWRKKENTKKAPGRPAHNAHPQTCSGEPIDPKELQMRVEREKKKAKSGRDKSELSK